MAKLMEYHTKEEAAEFVATHIADSINRFNPTETKPYLLGLPTGSSPEPVYKKLIELYKAGKVSFRNVVTFNMDEYCGISPTNEQSYHYFMNEKFFNHIDIKKENIHILNGLAEDYEEECKRYEQEILKYAPFQIFMGGIGPNGHIAFNEAGSNRDTVTRKVELQASTIKANSRFFANNSEKVPKYALSVGISTVLDHSKEVIILIFGKAKHEILQKTLKEPISSTIPSTFLREHENCLLVCDKDAALG